MSSVKVNTSTVTEDSDAKVTMRWFKLRLGLVNLG